MKPNEKVKEFYKRFTNLIDNLLTLLEVGFFMRNFPTKLTDSLQYALSFYKFSWLDALAK